MQSSAIRWRDMGTRVSRKAQLMVEKTIESSYENLWSHRGCFYFCRDHFFPSPVATTLAEPCTKSFQHSTKLSQKSPRKLFCKLFFFFSFPWNIFIWEIVLSCVSSPSLLSLYECPLSLKRYWIKQRKCFFFRFVASYER